MRPRGGAVTDGSDPPVFRAVLGDTAKQQTTTIGSPDRIARIWEGWLDPPRLPSNRGNDEDLTETRRGVHVGWSAYGEEGDRFTVRRESRLSSALRHKLSRAAPGYRLDVDSAP